MRKIKRLLIITIMLVILLIGSSYTTFSSEQNDFKVRFSGEAIVSNKNKVSAKVVNDTNAVLEVSKLTSKETISYIVENTSRDLSADLSVNITNDNKEYFLVETKIEKTRLLKGEETKVILTVELIKEPIHKVENAKIGVQLISKPVQPEDEKQEENFNKPQTETPSTTKPSNNSSNVNKDYGYYEKDETPKTGDFKFIDIFRR